MRTIRPVGAALLASSAVIALAGCGSQSADTTQAKADPGKAFQDAYLAMASGKDLTTQTSVETTEADIRKIYTLSSTKTPPSAQTQKAMDAVAKYLPTLKVTTKVHSDGKNLLAEEDPATMSQDLSATLDGVGVQVVTVDKVVYAKADLLALGDKTGLYSSAELSRSLASAPASLAWLKEAVAGQPVGISLAQIEQLIGQPLTSVPGAGQQQSSEVLTKARKFLAENTTYTAGDSTADGQLITAKIKVKTVLNGLQSLAPASARSASPEPSPLPSSIRDDATLDIQGYVKDGKLAKSVVDLAQIKTWVDATKFSGIDLADWKKFAALDYQAKVVQTYDTAPITITPPAGARRLTNAELQELGRGLAPRSSKASLQ